MSLISKGENWEVNLNNWVASVKLYVIEPQGLWDYNSWAEDVLKYANKIKNKYKIKKNGTKRKT